MPAPADFGSSEGLLGVIERKRFHSGPRFHFTEDRVSKSFKLLGIVIIHWPRSQNFLSRSCDLCLAEFVSHRAQSPTRRRKSFKVVAGQSLNSAQYASTHLSIIVCVSTNRALKDLIIRRTVVDRHGD